MHNMDKGCDTKIKDMAGKVKYYAFHRNTLLEELQSILHEYPDNEQIIKELLQNAEDAGARSVKMGFCPSISLDHLPDAYKKYMSGPAFCLYNDSVFEEKDWDGITMVRKSNKHDDPLKVGKFGIGFKSVFHITDTVMVISGRKILFIDPLYEEKDPERVCCLVSISYFMQHICGPRSLEHLYGFFGIDENIIRNGNLNGTLFWFPLRNKQSELSDIIYTPEKVSNLLESFKKEIGSEMLFLTSIESIALYKMVNGSWDIDSFVSLDESCVQHIREERKQYKAKIKLLEKEMEKDDQWITKCDPIWMKCFVTYKIGMDAEVSSQEWLVINYFHAGKTNPEILNLITNRRFKYRPYIGIAARFDQPIQSGQIFCFLPLPFEDESPTGLPVHINGFFSLDSNRQHLKWPSHDQLHLEHEMLWNVLLVNICLPIVYIELFKSLQNIPDLPLQDLYIFYHSVPRLPNVKSLSSFVAKEVNKYLLDSEIPCMKSGRWLQTKSGYFAIFQDETTPEIRRTIIDLFSFCTQKIVELKGHEDLFQQWNGFESLKHTSPRETRILLQRDRRYIQFEDSCKEHLLFYCCSDSELSDLCGIELLPLQSGRYQAFQRKQNSYQETIYLCEREELEILIGKEDCLVLRRLSFHGDLLMKLAGTGFYNFQILQPQICVQILKEIVWEKGNYVKRPLLCNKQQTIFGREWLSDVWKYLSIHFKHSLGPVKDLSLIKTIESDELKKVSDSFLDRGRLTLHNIKTLAYFQIWVVDMTFHDHPLLEAGKGIVQKNTDEGKSQLLQKCIENGINTFNNIRLCCSAEREWFKEFLPRSIPDSLVSTLRCLIMFTSYSSVSPLLETGYTSVENCKEVYIGDRDFPIQFPSRMIFPSNQLLSQLLATMVDLTDCVQNCLAGIGDGTYNINDAQKRKLCFYILEKQEKLRNWRQIQTCLNKVDFIKNGCGHLCCANNLYDERDNFLRELFLKESKFPKENKKDTSLLQLLEFKSIQSPSFIKDVVNTCENFRYISDAPLKERKSNALLQLFRQNPTFFRALYNSIREFDIVPINLERNNYYPNSMQWFSRSKTFVSLDMLYGSQYQFIIGSVLPTPSSQWEEFIDNSRTPPIEGVIEHFSNVVRCYQQDEHAAYCLMMKDIYKYLSQVRGIALDSFLPFNCLLTERGFVPASEIYIERSNTDVNLEPYFCPLPKEYMAFEILFESIGCHKNQSSYLLVLTLDKMQEKHNKINIRSGIEDLVKVEKILIKLSELPIEELSILQGRIKMPIQTEDKSKLVLKLVHECAYSESDWLSRTFTEEDNTYLIHSSINKEIAIKLGVRSLKKITLSDAEEIFMEFGQSEPLTQRLNRLLEEGYKDGLSVPKELIQNADDAGATKVHFLYDERENEDARSCLLNDGMEGCQGPALWVYNNAIFTSSDFENIKKLSGATKKEDTTKIGKFGLGFNAVYNLTDVPSFVSGTSLVYLDPHGKYLGDVIFCERSPGIKLNLGNKDMLRKWKNQFKPFENVFKFRSSMFDENQTYDGTLFRFPLRTKQQAYTSEICSKDYSKKEMGKLLKQICKTIGNMIIFTQNIKEIKIFHVNSQSKNPDKDRKLVLELLKEEKFENAGANLRGSILMAASRHCNDQFGQKSQFLVTCRSRLILSSPGHDWVERNDPFREETEWIISWAIGNGKARKLFQMKESDGALPLCSVGIPIETLNDNIFPVYLGAKNAVFENFGFYNRGHIFCFLPLPIESPLAFHLNGSFAVSSDRQRLLTKTEDDKENTRQSTWNDALLSDSAVEATLGLLMVINNASAETCSCYELWPTMFDFGLWKSFGNEFYKAIIQRQLPVFKTEKGYKSFKECIFLHKDIRKNRHVNQIAFDVLKKNPLNDLIITEIPLDIYMNLEKCQSMNFIDHVITFEQFITKSFLPNIAKLWGAEFDKIVLEALRSKNACILKAIRQSNCILSCKKKVRQYPRNLVHPNSAISGIFLRDAERFPAKLFCEETDLEILVDLGMMKYEIPFDVLQSQSKGVSKLATTCAECALSRSKEIIRYIQLNVPTEKKRILSEIPFLPVKRKPANWPPIKWYFGSSSHKGMKCFEHKEVPKSFACFEKPNNLYFPTLVNLVGCSKAVFEGHGQVSSNEYLQDLGVKNENDIDVPTLKCQINEIIKAPKNAQIEKIEEMCKDIYATITKRLAESDPDFEEFACSYLSKIPCVLTDKKFVYPKQVIFNLLIDCSPYLFGLRSCYVKQYKAFLEKIGVRQLFEPDDIINALFQIRTKFDGKQLSKGALSLVSRLTTLFEDGWSIQKKDLFLPDENGFFYPIDELCMNDFDWISTTKPMKFLNKAISPKVANIVGIKSKREQSIMNESDEFGEEFGQHEELTNRIERILDGYPQACILKELLQNADDAGAKVLHFIKDYRHHATEHVFSDNWKDLQGPALCVYNDSVFSEKDLEGIQSLGVGSKRDDHTSIGQYGVGFNVVYHLTDVPTFLTRDSKNSLDTLCILDPHLKYIRSASKKKPGRKFTNASDTLRNRYTDILPCYLEKSDIWNSSRGTLFRFPLRSTLESSLSQRITNCEELDELLNNLKKGIAECLLFLHNINEVNISSVKLDGSLEREFTVTTKKEFNSYKNENLHTLICNARELLKTDELHVCRMDRKEMKYQLQINVNNELTEEWLIVTAFGFLNRSLIPTDIQKAYANKELALLPISGVAYNLTRKKIEPGRNATKSKNEKLTKFSAFCFLPLPLDTGLPVHVNGHFALNHEARQNIQWSDTEGGDIKNCWNKCLIENVIVPTYVSVLCYLRSVLLPKPLSEKSLIQLDRFHEAFPNMRKMKDKVWKHTAKSLYKHIAESGCCVFPIVQRDYDLLGVATNKDMPSFKSETTEPLNHTLKVKQLEIKWVPVLSAGFPAYFDEIKDIMINELSYNSRYEQNHADLLKQASKQSEFISGVLKDLGMKIIESPMWIFSSMKEAEISVQKVSPKNVLLFLKSYGSNEMDSCKIAKINVPVSETRFNKIHFVNNIFKFCLYDKNLSAMDFAGVPLLLSEAENLHVFEEKTKLFLTSVRNLLPQSANRIAHSLQFHELGTLRLFKNFVKVLDIEDFFDHIKADITEDFYRGSVEHLNKVDLPNETWLARFWAFLLENLCYLEQKYIDKSITTENPSTVLCSTVLKHLGQCSFLPVYINKVRKLYPLKSGKHVLKLRPEGDNSEQLALKVLNVPVWDESCSFPPEQYNSNDMHFISDVSNRLLASVENVIDILNCIFFNRTSLNLEQNACATMLGFFDGHLRILKEDVTCIMKLKCLPFYSGLCEIPLTLQEKQVIVLPEKIPTDGLKELGLMCNVTFIRSNKVSLDFFEYLGCMTPTSTELYIKLVLPNFSYLPKATILRHLMFIKNIIIEELKYYPSEFDKQNLSRLDNLLKHIPFIPIDENRLAKACQFFNPHIDIYKIENQLCRQSEIPPSPFNEKMWEEFLVHCGMKSEMTPEIFADFANRLEKLGNYCGLTSTVLANSSRMVKLLFSEETLLKSTHWFHMIQNVKFLKPHRMSRTFQTLAPQFGRENKLICFRDSTLPSNDLLVWTVMGIVSKDIEYSIRSANMGAKAKLLGLQENPSLSNVLNHIKILCLSLNRNIGQMCAENKETESEVTKVMAKIYEFLQQNENKTSVDFLREIPFIFIKDRRLFVLPEQVVLDINTNEEIPPYLCKAPLYFGQFYNLFHRHGAKQVLTCEHLANVLSKIWKKSKGGTLEPNEIDSTKTAVKLLFSKLRSENTQELESLNLYLPSKSKRLIQSEALVFIDDKLLEGRIKVNLPDMQYFAGFQELDIDVDDPVSEIKRLPERHLPQFLSKIVFEQIDSESKKLIVPSDFARKLQAFLQCAEFCSGVCRLIRDEQYRNNGRRAEGVEMEIFEKLQSVNVRCIQQLITVMVFQDKILPNTNRSKSLFTAEEVNNKILPTLCVYFTEASMTQGSLRKKHWTQISLSLNVYLGKPLKENIIHLPDLLACINEKSEIENVLDCAEIFKLENAFLVSKFMPNLGSEIPIDLHHLLDNSCTFIKEGKYVAYELYDPIIDDEEVCDTEPVYILAKILKASSNREMNLNADEWTMIYILDIGSENPIEVLASTVYKFMRSDIDEKGFDVVDSLDVFSWKTDRIRRYIRDVLSNAFRKSDREFKRTYKRLILQYHPDKHMDNKDYFNDLYLFMVFIKNRLENGYSVDDDDIFMSDNISEYPQSSFEKTVINRVVSDVEKKRFYKAPEGHFFSGFSSRGSQPGQARRWFRQAEYDLQAATLDKHQSSACNWACFKCHQSAEKALKALLYQMDADKVVQTHFLTALTGNTGDCELTSLALRLEGVTGNYFRMRYPDAVPCGHGMAVPSDMYSPSQAEEVIEYASEILERVRSKLPNL